MNASRTARRRVRRYGRQDVGEDGSAADEEWKWQNSAVWSHDGVVAAAKATKVKVRLTFAHGASLPDPAKLFNASLDADTMRTIDILEGDTIDGIALKALVREAVAYNGRQDGVGPVLLSGGNPQVPKGDGDGPVQDYIAAMPGWKGGAGRSLDNLIVRNVPHVRKAVRWNSPCWNLLRPNQVRIQTPAGSISTRANSTRSRWRRGSGRLAGVLTNGEGSLEGRRRTAWPTIHFPS